LKRILHHGIVPRQSVRVSEELASVESIGLNRLFARALGIHEFASPALLLFDSNTIPSRTHQSTQRHMAPESSATVVRRFRARKLEAYVAFELRENFACLVF
jgi:hypothetical protein